MAKKATPAGEAHTDLVFITKYRGPWEINNRSLSNEIRKLLDSSDINGHRDFYDWPAVFGVATRVDREITFGR